MSTVLVTGGAGYVGSHTCKALAAAGYLPVTYDNLSRGHRAAVRWGPFEAGDIADRPTLESAIARWQPTAILHFAAYAYVGESVADPLLYYRNNVAGSAALIEAALAQGLKRLVFSSTCAAYGVPPQQPITEATVPQPINPYGASKLMVERMLTDASMAHGLTAICLRYFNAAGADPEGELGEDHDPEPHLIPNVIAAAMGSGPPVKILGTDYPTPDGTCIRDYIHVSDLANAHVAALRYLEAGGATTLCNLGTGRGYSVAEIVAAVGRKAGHPVPVEHAPRRIGDPPALVADAALAGRLLGWKPELSDLDRMIDSAWDWKARAHNRQRNAS